MKQGNRFITKPHGKLTILLAIILIFLLLLLSFPILGNFLIAEDEPQKADIIIVLMGSGPDRMLGAADLYEMGYSDKIVMVRNLVRGYDLVVSQGVDIPHDTDIAKDVAVQLGVSEGDIKILSGDALSTKDEALAVREYLRNEVEVDSLIIVTSKYHSGRAEKIFVKAMKSLDRDVEVISCPTKYDDFNVSQWWKDREDLKRGVLEYLKLINFYTMEQFGM